LSKWNDFAYEQTILFSTRGIGRCATSFTPGRRAESRTRQGRGGEDLAGKRGFFRGSQRRRCERRNTRQTAANARRRSRCGSSLETTPQKQTPHSSVVAGRNVLLAACGGVRQPGFGIAGRTGHLRRLSRGDAGIKRRQPSDRLEGL